MLNLDPNLGCDPFVNDAAALYYGFVVGDLNAEYLL